MPATNNKLNMNTFEGITDATVASLTAKWGMGGGVATSFLGWLSSSGAAVAIGSLITIGGFIMNWVFQHKRDKRAQEKHDLEMALLKEELDEKKAIFNENHH